MTSYRTVDGDMADAVCKAHYGRESALVDVFEANPGLAAIGPILPAGVTILLPDLASPQSTTVLRLWD